jgi:hypothetical protein
MSQPNEEEWGEAYESWAQLRKSVETNDGVLRVQMWQLRDLMNAGRLGVHVRASISRELAGLGLAHLPLELPANQYDSVVLYRLGTAAAAVIAAINGGETGSAETVLRQLNAAGEAQRLQSVVEKIDELREKLDELDQLVN